MSRSKREVRGQKATFRICLLKKRESEEASAGNEGTWKEKYSVKSDILQWKTEFWFKNHQS